MIHKAFPGETGSLYYDGKYRLGSLEKGKAICLAEGVVLKLLEEENQLCPSYYDPGTICISGGRLSIKLKIPNTGQIIIISDQDLKSGWSKFHLNGTLYSIAGVRTEVINYRKDLTYLYYRITK